MIRIHRMCISAACYAVLVLSMCTPAFAGPQQQTGLRVFISVDMEGITGVVNVPQLGPGGFEYDRFRKLMTEEVNAAIDGAIAAGATAITVADSHGNGMNILPDELNPMARLIRSWPRPLEMMEGIDQGADAVLFIGYHASIGTAGAVRAHTISSARFYDVRLNGQHVSEGILNAAIAGHFNVPVVLVTGDNLAVKEVQDAVGKNIEGVIVKRGIGYHAADNLSPQVTRTMIKEQTTRALKNLKSFRPYKVAEPARLEISFKSMINAEILAMLPGIERVDGATIAFTGKDMVAVAKFLSFVTNYDSNN